MESSFWSAVFTLVRKDLALERSTGQIISVTVFFALAAIVTFNLALQGDIGLVRQVSTGLLWIVILLAGTLGLTRSFAAERENRSIDALLMAPISRQAIYLGKVISVFIFTGVLELAVTFLFAVFFNQPFLAPAILGILLLGTMGFVAAGVLIGTMVMQTRVGDVLIPVVLLPLVLPVVLAAASATQTIISRQDYAWADIGFPIAIVCFYNVFILIAGLFLYPIVLES